MDNKKLMEGGIAAVLDRVTRETGTEVNTISRDRTEKGDIPFIVVDGDRKVFSAAQVVEEFERTQPLPYRRKGLYTAASVESLLRWMDANCPDSAPVFGVGLENLYGEWQRPKLALTGIGNYSDHAIPGWHDFKVTFNFPVAHSWLVWAARHSTEEKPQWFDQAEFADFIEQRIYDLSEPRRGETLSEAVTRFIEASGKKDAASPAEMFKVSRDLKVMSKENIEVQFDTQSGESRMHYTQEHTGPGGRPVKIPDMFYIRIPVFFGQEPVLIGVKLRYRAVGQGALSWSYSLFAPDIIVADEFEKACEIVRRANRTLYLGSPDLRA
jgi:hypothetical protein